MKKGRCVHYRFFFHMHRIFNPLFGRGEKEEREREIEVKSNISLVWLWLERGKRELKVVGPTDFLVSSHLRRNRGESCNFNCFAILSFH
jgi:hypothetical protein